MNVKREVYYELENQFREYYEIMYQEGCILGVEVSIVVYLWMELRRVLSGSFSLCAIGENTRVVLILYVKFLSSILTINF